MDYLLLFKEEVRSGYDRLVVSILILLDYLLLLKFNLEGVAFDLKGLNPYFIGLSTLISPTGAVRNGDGRLNPYFIGLSTLIIYRMI